MIDKILSNLIYISDEEKNNLKDLLNSSIETDYYLENKYFEIMNKWLAEYSCFDIPNCIITISIDGKNKYYSFGEKKYSENNIFDLASMTKLYTEDILFSIIDESDLTLDAKIGSITDFYKGISHLSIRDLLSFNHTYLTKIDIRNCKNYEEGIKALRTIYLNSEEEGHYLYTDLPVMVLTDLLSIYTNSSYSELFNKYILEKYNLKNTYLLIDSPSYVTLNKGYVNDPKANIMGGFYGHAGVKASSKDFISFFNESFINNKNLDLFLTNNNTYKKDGTYANGVGKIGNINLPLKDGFTISSRYLSNCGFAIQGSTRCHAEICKIIIDNKEHILSFSIFMDLYTQYSNIKEYEKKNNKIITKEYTIDDNQKLVMTDIRKLLDYRAKPSLFKELIDEINISKYNDFYNYFKKI